MRPRRTAATFVALTLGAAVFAPTVGAFDRYLETASTGSVIKIDDARKAGAVCAYEVLLRGRE